MKEGRWLLLIHQLPPKPDYFRVKIWRRLQGLGAVAIKNSVYALPFSPQASEDFQWLRKEITAGGGEASVCRASFVDGLADPQIEALFRTARDADYADLTGAAEKVDSMRRSRDSSAGCATSRHSTISGPVDGKRRRPHSRRSRRVRPATENERRCL